MNTYYKVIIINIDTFESTVADERHFASLEEAECFVRTNKTDSQAAVVVTI